jgi:hypothetical protein
MGKGLAMTATNKFFVVLGGVLALWICWRLFRFLSPGWAQSTADMLGTSLIFLAPPSPLFAAVLAGVLYRSRKFGLGPTASLVAYLVISFIGAVAAYGLGAAFGAMWACSYGGNLCPIVGMLFIGPFVAALAIVLVAVWWRKARD